MQKRSGGDEAAYKKEVELHDKTTKDLDKARKAATGFQAFAQSQKAEAIQARQRREEAESQLQQTEQRVFELAAENESLKNQIQVTLAAKDEAIAEMKKETNEIRVQMQQRFQRMSAELASATDCVNSKQAVIDQLKADVKELKDDLEVTQAQVQVQ